MSTESLCGGLGSISRLSKSVTRSVSAENVYGEKGRGGMAEMSASPQPEVARIGQHWNGPNPCARDLGRTWKVRPCLTLPKASTTALMDVDGPGVIQHIWITVDSKRFRDLILRMYWDGETTPSVESPLGDFFCNGWKTRANILALPINVNPSGGLNCYFPMPFRKHARVTVENRAPEDQSGFFYSFTYALGEVDSGDACFHARFRRRNPLPAKEDYTILDDVRGRGQYVGAYMAWQQNSSGWRSEDRYLPLQDDIASVAYWYQTEPHRPFPALPDRDYLEVI